MTLQKKSVDELKSLLRLNAYEARVWMALLSRGIAAAGELSDMSGVPRSRCYDVLESLEKKGFIIMKIGKPIKYIAVPPAEVTHRVQKELKSECNTELSILDSFSDSDVFRGLEMLHKKEIANIDPAELTHVVIGRRNIYSQLKVMIENAQKSVFMVTNGSLLQKKADALRTAYERAHSRGIKIQIATPNGQTNRKIAQYVQFTDAKDLEGRFTIIDNKRTLFTLTDEATHQTYDAAIIIDSEYFSTGLSTLTQISLHQ